MAHTFGTNSGNVSSGSNPITGNFTTVAADTVLVLLMVPAGAVIRTGGAPTYAARQMVQADTAQIALVTPEASAEIWYLLNPPIGNLAFSIPNGVPNTIRFKFATGRAKSGGKSAFDGAIGANATGTNPAPGALTLTEPGDIVFAVTGGGWTTWAPSAQAGTVIENADDGATGRGDQYSLQASAGSLDLGWTFGTIDDWGAVAVAFKEVPPNTMQNYMRPKAASGMSAAGIG